MAWDSHGVRLLMLVPIRPLGDWAGNLIVYKVLRVHSPYPMRARPVNPEQTRRGFTPRSLSRGPQHPPSAHAHTLPQARPARPRVDLPSPRFPATQASPPSPGEGGSRGGSGANPHRASLILLADHNLLPQPPATTSTKGLATPRVLPWPHLSLFCSLRAVGGGRGPAELASLLPSSAFSQQPTDLSADGMGEWAAGSSPSGFRLSSF